MLFITRVQHDDFCCLYSVAGSESYGIIGLLSYQGVIMKLSINQTGFLRNLKSVFSGSSSVVTELLQNGGVLVLSQFILT